MSEATDPFAKAMSKTLHENMYEFGNGIAGIMATVSLYGTWHLYA